MQSGENEESWSIASIEEQYIEAIERQPNYENQYLSERDASVRNIFHNFQESATSIAQLYRGNNHNLLLFELYFCSANIWLNGKKIVDVFVITNPILYYVRHFVFSGINIRSKDRMPVYTMQVYSIYLYVNYTYITILGDTLILFYYRYALKNWFCSIICNIF